MKALLLALLVGLATVARAAPATPGQQLYEAGERAFHLHHWEEARRSFAAAYELDRKPELLYDVALATWRLAREDETLPSLQAARAAYQRYLDEATAGRRRVPAEQALAEIDARMPKPKPAARPPVRDEDDDPARPLDPYVARPLPPIPKPIIITLPKPPPPAPPRAQEPKAQAPTSGPALPLPSGMVEVTQAGDAEVPRSPPPVSAPAPKPERASHHRSWVTPVIVVGTLCVAGLAIGLGVGLSQSSGNSSSTSSNLGVISY